ncbi:MAG: choice-of-anchor Q domain-containing protein [Lysobacterales bacterium]
MSATRLPCCVLLLTLSSAASAATFCVSTSNELVTALAAAETNNQDDEIRLRAGTYSAPSGGFRFRNGVISGGDDADIRISGNWSVFFGNPCGIQLSLDPFDTVLDGNFSTRVMEITPRANTAVHVSLLAFLSGNTVGTPTPQAGAGLHVRISTSHDATVTIERNAFVGNVAEDFGGGLSAGSGAGFFLINNLFIANTANCRHGAASLTDNSALGAFVINNTVAFNNVGDDCPQSNDRGGGVRIGGSANMLFANNIFWGNENQDLMLQTSTARLVANDIGVLFGSPGAGSGINFNFDPDFSLQTFLDFRLAETSPLLDLGILPSINASWQLPDTDLDGNLRVQGVSVDLGAYESAQRLLADGFE